MNRFIVVAAVLAALTAPPARSQTIETEIIVDGVYLRDSTQRAQIKDMTMSVESYSRKLTGDGAIKEEKEFLKTDYMKDTLFRANFHEFYLDSVRQDSAALAGQARDDADRRREGRFRDANINPTEVFYPSHRSNYEFTLKGTETKEGRACYHIVADCLVDKDSLLEGEYWYETEGMNLVYAEFRPARLRGALKQLDMQMWYAPGPDGYWLPMKFHLLGRGRAMLVIKFNFEVAERYFDHKVNTGLTESFFKETTDEK
ncbi:MAG: hypothetical protein PHR28_08065 [candidate division Zixibacteria bacterium]|nr:hypothetical protein [candidate division Zixibacteria bacterium]